MSPPTDLRTNRLLLQRHPLLYFGPSPLHGRGVFCGADLTAGTLLEVCPALLLPKAELPSLKGRFLYAYYFLWGEAQDQPAIVLGFGSLYNHQAIANARYDLDLEQQTVDFTAVRDIPAGTEICVNYNGEPNDATPVWFELSADDPRNVPTR